MQAEQHPPTIDAPKVTTDQSNQRAIQLLATWLDQDLTEGCEEWEAIKQALDEDRESVRPLFA